MSFRHSSNLSNQGSYILVSLHQTPIIKHCLGSSHSLLVGRSPTTDITLFNPSVSNKHAIISVQAQTGSVYLRDMESTNGTFVNGDKMSRGEMRELVAGDIIRFGFDDKSWRLEKDEGAESSETRRLSLGQPSGVRRLSMGQPNQISGYNGSNAGQSGYNAALSGHQSGIPSGHHSALHYSVQPLSSTTTSIHEDFSEQQRQDVLRKSISRNSFPHVQRNRASSPSRLSSSPFSFSRT